MLNLTRDTASDIKFRAYGNACLTDLAVVLNETCIDGSARSTDFATESVGEFKEQVEILLAARN